LSEPNPIPPEVWARVQAFLAGDGEDPEQIASDLVDWVDGRPADDLVGMLDALRDAGAYPVSLHVLATAWGAELPDPLAGRVAADWIGTILHGLGDREAATEAARLIADDATKRGAHFQSDLGDLLLQWELYEVAGPLVEASAKRQPGDMSARFNLGIVQKHERRWAECRESFELVLRVQPSPAAHWNLGIACTALRDPSAARAAWQALGMAVPPGEGDFAAPGETRPVRLPTAEDAPRRWEVVWGVQLCPARVALTGMPRFGGPAGFGDVVLVDGVPVGEVRGAHENTPILAFLDVFERKPGTLYRLAGPDAPRDAVTALVDDLRARGFAVADWTGLAGPGDRGTRLGVTLGPADDPRAVLDALRAHAKVTLFAPDLLAAAGQDPAFHRAALESAGLTGL
jgi:hypothetical protein